MRLIIFDIDGTLVDSQDHIVEAQRRAFAKHRLPAPSRALSLSVVGLSLREAFAALVGEDGPLDALAEDYKAAWAELVREPGYREVLYPGARETIAELAASPETLLGIATGKSRRGMARVFAAQGWDEVFATVQTADDHPSKPHPSMLTAALAETGCAAGDAVMIGDTQFDMAMAVAAGVRPLGVAWGYHRVEALLAAGAETVVPSFEALLASLGGRLCKTGQR